MTGIRGALAALTAVPLVLLAACDSGGGAPASRGTAETGRPHSGPMIKEAWSALGGGRSRLEVRAVERHRDRSVLRLYVTNPERDPKMYSFATSVAGSAFGQLHFTLVDPVGHKAYGPLYDRGGEGNTVGSDLRFTMVRPGVRYEAVLAFPRLPESVRAVTVVTPTTAGEFTGVPVIDGKGEGGPTAPVVDDATPPSPGATVAFKTREQQGDASGRTYDLYGLTEGEVQSTSTSASEQTIGLRTDVLFAFDKATLSARAKAILDQVANETRAKADPAKPPILITGHTDGKGTPGYNMPLSQRRADVVLKELQARLGTAYQYKAEGKGETEPVAKEGGTDDEEARRRNRRVEISYQIKQQATETTSTTETVPLDKPGTGTGAPAAFHPDGPTVASRTAEIGRIPGQKRRIDVKPFYRDGAYLVAVFEITNAGSQDLLPTDSYMGDNGSYGRFGAFSVIDPATNTAYRGVRMGPTEEVGVNLRFVDPGWAIFRTEPGTANRGFFYVPAPPPSVKAVTFDAGPFGKIPNVPIR
ncbi:OmpA family protein [Actinomadura sp. NAK00032]|uniref:OmpA family protein n=1 Tax=Actinomadura sp. NAK00032 TaxID=2742128 RepID=UPI00159023E5|nr:OmpA family protein [Actinomadura sp. NAK00032]QKW34178.1 OmpA family protein [Actinomadura sp. NAK00032]